MIAGHYGVAGFAKSRAPAVPLWALLTAAALIDLVALVFFVTGIETVDDAPGTTGGYGAFVIDATYSHSLTGALVIAVAAGAFGGYRWGRSAGLILAAVVASHWVGDLLTHREDLAIFPGNLGDFGLLGLGLYKARAVSVLVELGLVVGGAVAYWRAARAAVRSAGEGALARADRVASLMVIAGVVTLGLDLLGL